MWSETVGECGQKILFSILYVPDLTILTSSTLTLTSQFLLELQETPNSFFFYYFLTPTLEHNLPINLSSASKM